MRVIFWMLAALGLVAIPAPAAKWKVAGRKTLAELPGGARFEEINVSSDGRTVRIHAILFNSRRHELHVLDNASAKSSAFAALPAEADCFGAVNGGYFHPDFKPVGLVISGGKELHGFERARLLSGVLTATSDGFQILRVAEYRPSPKIRAALQAGPFLVDESRPVSGLESRRLARRTVVCSDGKNQGALLVMSHVTLADAADILDQTPIFPGNPVRRALNLDGGSSTGIWVATTPKAFLLAPFTPVRNLVGVSTRGPT